MAHRSVHRSIPDLDRPNSRRHQSASGDRPNMSVWASTTPDLNLVLCGSDVTLKASVLKSLTGEKTLSSSHQTEFRSECVMEEEKIHGRLISLVELPALSRLSEEEVMRQTLQCVSFCHPGVHAFIIVVPDTSLTDGDKAEIEKIQRIFDSREHFILLFTTDPSVEEHVKESINSSSESQRLISLYGGQYRVMGLKEAESTRQIPDLLDYIENMKTEPYSLQMYVKAQENRVRDELEEQHKKELKRKENEIKELQKMIYSEGAESEEDLNFLRIVLIGRTGSGKSATGNTILGRNEFQSLMSSDSVTTVCQKGVGEVDGRSVAVVDTPGLFDTTLTNEQVVKEIVKCVSLALPGPHVFVIVLSLERYVQVDMDTLDQIKKIFGHYAAQFSIILFTRGDKMENSSIEQYVEKSKSADLKKLIRDCGYRFLAFNNREKQDKSQVVKLLNMIEELKNSNQGRYFTNSMFEEAEMSIKKRMEEIMKERERENKTQHEKLRIKYEYEMKELKKKLEEEKRNADEERIQRDNEFKRNEVKLLKDFEEKNKKDLKRQDMENKKLLKDEKQQNAEYRRKIDEIKREMKNQRSEYEKQQKEREEEDRKREEKYRQDKEKMRYEHECIIAELQNIKEKEINKRDLMEKRRNEEEEEERQRWKRKIKEAENDRKEIQEEIKRQQREWEDEKKRQMREREEEDRKRKQKHEEQLTEKQEQLEKMRQKVRREREEKEKEYEAKKTEMKRHYERLEQERKDERERRQQEDDERQEERKTWKKMTEDLKRKHKVELKRREREEEERKEREEEQQDEMRQKHKNEKEEMEKKYQYEAKKQAEEFKKSREIKLQHVLELTDMLKDCEKQQEFLEKLYNHLKEQKGLEIKELKQEVEKLKNKSGCVIQ